MFGLSYVVRSEPGWDPPPDEHGRTTLSDDTPIRLAGYPNPPAEHSAYLYSPGKTTPFHLDDGHCRALCGAATAGHPPPGMMGQLVCTRCAGISLRAEADRIDPPLRTAE